MQNLPTPPSVRVRNIASREEWLEWRKDVVGASDAGAVIDLDPFRTTLQLYLEKTGRIPHESSELMERGIDLEPGIVNALKRRHPAWQVWQPELFYDVPALQIGCTPDAFFREPGAPDALGIAQCKLVTLSSFVEHWDNGQTAPVHYILQTAIEAMLTGAKRAILTPYVIGEHRGRLYEVEVQLEAEETKEALKVFLEYNAAFWERIRQEDPPPLNAERDASVVRRLYPREIVDAVDLSEDSELQTLLDQDALLSCDISNNTANFIAPLEKARTAVRTQIKAKLGIAASAICAGKVITWKTIARKATQNRQLRIRPLKSRTEARSY